MYDHAHLKKPTNICCFHGPLVTSKNSTSYLNLFARYSSLKNPAFWLVLTFLDHNSRTKFFPNNLLLQKVKRSLTLSYWSKTAYASEWIRSFYNPKNVFFWTFWSLWAHLNFFFKNQGLPLSFLYDV